MKSIKTMRRVTARVAQKGDVKVKGKWVLMLLLTVALLIPSYNSVANAQAALIALILGPKVASENFYFSMKLGANVADLTGVDDSGYRLGFNFGLIATIKVNDKFYIVPEFAPLSHKGAKDIPFVSTGNSSLDSLLGSPSTTARQLNYIDIPVLLRFHPHENL